MHLNCHTAYPKLAFNYFREKLHQRSELQKQLTKEVEKFSISSEEKKNFSENEV